MHIDALQKEAYGMDKILLQAIPTQTIGTIKLILVNSKPKTLISLVG